MAMTPNKSKKAPTLTDEVFTVDEVASLLKLNPQTIRNWVEAGALPALRIGRRVRIKRAVLQDILDNGLKVVDDEGSEMPGGKDTTDG
jgi:excisionase family DNA binding protein